MNILQGDDASQSSDVSRRLDEGAADQSDGPEESSVILPKDSSVSISQSPSSPSLWKRLSGLAGGSREHVTTRPLPRENALSPVRELDLPRSPVLSPRVQLEQIRVDTELMETSSCTARAAQN